jgi:hypothetical protein
VAPFISHTTLVIGMGLGMPNGPVLGSGNVSATTAMTMGPGRKLTIPRHRFKKKTNLLLPLNGLNLLQITSNFTFDGPRAKATLASMGGPGSQTWCPNNPVCSAGGGFPFTGPFSNNGRVIYRKGPRQFGGAMQMGLKGFGDNAIPMNPNPLRVAHLLMGSPALATTRTLVPGHQLQHQVGMGTMRVPAIPATEKVHLTPVFVTQPVMTSSGLIIAPGPKVTTMSGLTNTMGGPLLRTFTETTTNRGFSWTTGTIFVQALTGSGSPTFFTVMGSDMRTALGAGNLSLVAGGLHRRGGSNGVPPKSPYASYNKVYLTLAPFVPSMSPAGAAAAGALMLLAVGYAPAAAGARRVACICRCNGSPLPGSSRCSRARAHRRTGTFRTRAAAGRRPLTRNC